MPAPTRRRTEPTDDWQQIQLLTDWPEQRAYELIRPSVLFGEPVAQRADETGTPERTLRRRVRRFLATGMASLFPDAPQTERTDRRELPDEMRQLLVDLKAEYPAFRTNELATICYVMTGRRPSSHTVERVLQSDLPPQRLTRQFPLYAEMEPSDRRQAIVQLHAEGWNVKSIAGYLETTRTRVYETLRRWMDEGVHGLEDKPSGPTHPRRKVNVRAMNEVLKLQENSPRQSSGYV